MQQIKSERYRGEHLQFSAFVKSEDVEGSAGLWVRIDHSSGEILAFGILLHGQGQIWMDELSFKTVDESVPVTEQNTVDDLEETPVNLNFEG
ncbi:hypothetical protein [Bacillus sp. NPDC093026]|uniref:hypothetical protein n=1 Tax=Bacillus sp. NPDC093026 TaxID=3363948 RepID=UPI003803B679